MGEQKKPNAVIAEEQLDALVQSLLPTMREFFSSERGKKIWDQHLKEVSQGNGKAA